MRKISGLFGALVLALGVVSCGGGGDTTGTGGGGGGGGGGGNCPANTFCLTINNTFSPTALTVAVGTTVSWRNDALIQHNVTWNDAAGRSAALAGDGTGDIGTGTESFTTGTHTRLFNTAGVYGFKCTIHLGMNGTLTVQ
jgi:plastocyanin